MQFMHGPFTFCFILLISLAWAKSYYEILGVSPFAEQREIKKAYYKLSLTLHPDKIHNPTDEDIDRFTEIVKAYEVLSDPEKKRIYDLSDGEAEKGEDDSKQYTNQPFSFRSFSPNYRFEATFSPRFLARAPVIILSYPVTMANLFEGIAHKTIYFNRTMICPLCKGTGASDVDHVVSCPFCNGTGLREYVSLASQATGYSYTSLCSECKGSGFKHSDSACSSCHGNGLRLVEDYVELNIKGGIRSDYVAQFRGVGNEQFLRRRGDVMVKLKLLKDPVFNVDGYNLHMSIVISVVEAFTGFTRAIRLPSGELFTISQTDRSFDGQILIIQGKGIPIGTTGIYGSLNVHIEMYYPLLLTHDERSKLRQLHTSIENAFLFIQYHSSLFLQSIQAGDAYEWCIDEFFYSDVCSLDFVCYFSFVPLIEYY